MLKLQIVRSRAATWMSAGFLALVILMVLSLAAFFHRENGADAVRHTVEVDGQLWRVLSLVQDAEIGQRGFILTADPAFLEPYSQSATALGDAIGQLAGLTADNAAQVERLASLRGLVDTKIGELGGTIALVRSGNAQEATGIVAEGGGKATMDRIRAVVLDMRANESVLLGAREASVARTGTIIRAILLVLFLLLLVLAGLAIREAARRASLSRFLPQELSGLLARDDDALREGRRQLAAVVFVDMRGSTALAEGLDPARLSRFLSAFRRRVMRIARRHGGVVDKFIGDGALIVFGLPEPKPDDAARALLFATDLVATVARWNVKRAASPAVAIGIGVHFGEVFCGIIGEEQRLEFTVLGDTVNVAARLETATKAHGVPILVSEAAWRAAGADEAAWQEVGREPLAGRREAMAYLTPTSLRLGSATRHSADASNQDLDRGEPRRHEPTA